MAWQRCLQQRNIKISRYKNNINDAKSLIRAVSKSLIRAVSNLKLDGKLRDTIIIDIPRAVEGKNLRELIIGIESIKNSILSEDRYHFSQEEIPDVKVVIMCNNLPDPNWLTADRWRAYAIVNNDLQPINIQETYAQQQDEYRHQQLQRRRAYNGYQGKQKNKQTDLEL